MPALGLSSREYMGLLLVMWVFVVIASLGIRLSLASFYSSYMAREQGLPWRRDS